MQKITPTLWFDKNAEEAANFYISAFGNGAILDKTFYTEVGHDIHGMDAGTLITVDFEIEGFKMIGLNGGPIFQFTPAISFMVNCATTQEVDSLWAKLSEGGKALMPLDKYPFSERYGWCQDKFGVSWQISISADTAAPKIVPSFLFVQSVAGKAEEAINTYTTIFKNSSKGMMARYGAENAPDKEGTLMYASFVLEGQTFSAMDSAQDHKFTFTEAVSLLVECEDQAEIDSLWTKLSAYPESEQCGWLKDQFGVSWQIVPKGMNDMMNSPDKEKAARAMAAMLQMKKLNIQELENAFEGK